MHSWKAIIVSASLALICLLTTAPASSQAWVGTDVGAVGAPGNTSDAGGVVTINASGADIGGTQDEMHFAYVSMSGDIDIVGRLPELTRTHSTQTKAGLMIRASLAANSPHAFSFIRSGGYAGMLFRAAQGGNSNTIAGPRAVRPGWFRLTRIGNTFTAYTGQDGVSWTQVGQANINMPATVFVGLAVTSRVDGTLATAEFDNIALNGSPTTPDTTPPSVPQNLRTTSASPTNVVIEWDASTDTGGSGLGGYRIYRNGSSTPIGSTSTTQYNDSTVSANTTYSYGVSAIDNASPPNESVQAGPLQVTTPAATVNAPNVVGMTQAAAEQAIANAGLSVGTITTQTSASVPAGSVISQQPAGGTAVGPGTAINLVISLGSGTTPPSEPQPLVLTTSSDVGNVAAAGSMTQANGMITIVGSGNDIGGTQDEMHFGYIELTGDVDVVARLPELERAHTSLTKAGIMIRESLAANSRHAYSYIRSAGYAGLLSRATTGGTSANVEGPRVTRPGWLRLRRVGNVFTAFTGENGTTWTQVGQVTIPMSSSALVGLAVTARNDGQFATAGFDNATVSGSTGSGAITTPNVVGQTQAAAQAAITSAGLTVGTITSQSSASVPSGSVISQNPAAGANVAPGTAINLVVSTGPAPDTTPPTVPGNLTVTGTTASTITLSWTASQDQGGSGLAGYRIFRDGGIVPIGTTTGLTFTDTGRAPNTSYSYTVVAFDNATPPNESNPAGPVTGTTTGAPPPDTTPPSVPQNLTVTGTTATTVTLSWQASTDNAGGSGVAGYRIYRDGAGPVGTVTGLTFTDTGRTPSTAYSYRVSAFDNASNESAQSASVVANTQAAGGTCTATISGGAAVMNVGELAVYTANVTGGGQPVTYQWSVSGNIIRDYQESTSAPWAVYPMTPADYQQQTIQFYWKPDPSQIHPLNGGPVNRTVSVQVNAGGATCSAQVVVSVERNSTNINRQAEDFYTNNHRGAGNRGRVRNDHSAWHQEWVPGVPNYGSTLFDFHREFVDRFNNWRQEFGYPPVVPWDPGTPLPVGPDVNHSGRNANYQLTPRPSWFTLAGGGGNRPNNGTACDTVAGQNDLMDFPDRNALGCAVNMPMHSNVHNRIGGDMATTAGAPRDPIFWRWHDYMDLISQEWLAGGGSGSAMLAIPTEEQRLVADEAATMNIVAANHEHHKAQRVMLAQADEAHDGHDEQAHEAHAAPRHQHHRPPAATAGPNVTLLTEEQPDSVVKHRGRAARGPRIIYESPFRVRPFVTELPSVTVKFSVPVFGLTADALSVNGSPATQVTGSGAGPYVFSGFEVPADAEVLTVRFNGRKVRDAESNRGGNRSWRYWVVKGGEDRDHDGLDDAAEVREYFTNPRLRDTDGDGMPDGFEANSTCLNPFEDERAPHDMSGNTLPGKDDQDDDGLTDLEEYYLGSDPCSP